MSITNRIEQIVRESGAGDREIKGKLAKLCGISPQAVNQWFTGSTKKISSEYLLVIAIEYGVSVEWLISGKEIITRSARLGGALPVISLIQAGAWAPTGEPYLGEFTEMQPKPTFPANDLGPRSYIVEMKGDSMGKMAPKGFGVAIDPSKEPLVGAIAVFYLPNYGETHLGMYMSRAGRRALVFLDKSDPVTLEDDAVRCGRGILIMPKGIESFM